MSIERKKGRLKDPGGSPAPDSAASEPIDRRVADLADRRGRTRAQVRRLVKDADPAVKAGSKLGKKSVAKDAVPLLSGGNPRIAKADGAAPVKAYIAAMPGWKRDLGRRLDGLVESLVPGVRRAVKWNSPFYGVEGRGWFLSFHVFTRAVKVTFFRGTALRPQPPGGKGLEARWIDIHEDDFDEKRLTAWVRQAAAKPGWLA